ncbi:transglycosylase SLT domain-containing protein [Sinosporangium siamense]|uniref:aggregation-promoting factor C-terminal-like domain-containing protein n=1 Tax=Sinosporangium siamense TaxID=1367973 RepID=UPI0019514390|nr:transglycosylase SLT domain-containing protein [Sinosporangium siamense]
MNSTRVLRTAVATAVAAAVMSGSPAAAEAQQKDRPKSENRIMRTWSLVAVQQRAARKKVVPKRVIHRKWTTATKPKIRFKARKAKNSPGKNKAIAFRLVVQRAWSMRQFRCLDSLWTRESNWNHRAQNRSSGAYGIPQALPGRKMSGIARDWRFNPATQIRWGLKYIRGRYGTACGAWGHFQSHNWY